MTEVTIDGQSLTLADVEAVARGGKATLVYGDAAAKASRRSRELKQTLIETGQPIYGVTTGFGDSVTHQIAPNKAAELQRNLIRYHLNGTGPLAPAEVVRATLLIRANCLARGNSGVQPQVVERLLDLLRHDVLPQVPERGSVGASGDLVPLCYVAAALIGEGEVTHRGERRDAGEVLRELGLEPVVPEAKDGLGLINGTSFSAAFATLAVRDAYRLAALSEVCTALASEALLGNRGHYAPFIHENRPHRGQIASAAAVSALLDDSLLSLPHDQVVDLNDPLAGAGHGRLKRSIQDRYSLRCAPHVVGVLRDTLQWAEEWMETEINASTDNPLFDVESGQVHSGGNFYAGHVVQAMDSLKVATASVADLLDRQLALLVDEKFNNGLTPNLIPRTEDDQWEAGLHHGFKGMQLACSALTAEALKHAGPATVFSRSTEAHNQDKVSMAPIAARDARRIVELTEEVAAIHLLAACQALQLRGVDQMAPRTKAVHALVRTVAPFVDADRRMDADIAAVVDLIRSGALERVAGHTTTAAADAAA
ncbi:aromatic amino acid ammonia-lyase [Streptomyces sp. MB09-01]|uniref:HAL/PAL/TAL family ammonia-lyase n=1 Tax=Streptomyces sp. MB09-01 TaxID=3028666 RepID=UPI0029B38473|nr:aromatic amino acid ammonia-lyase [Streptomyces sp. MB09-01]MDX3537515.1 aromatic amino acid ammonia-lyase [Streptomyces sp. MB09-01]